MAIVSSFRDRAPGPRDLILGEVGLAGEVRAVSRWESRVKEAVKLGFQRVILPRGNLNSGYKPQGIELIGVASVVEALQYAIN